MGSFFELERDRNNLIFCKNLTNNSINSHFHSNIEILYVLDGEIEVAINGVAKTLTGGCSSVANSYDVHSYHTRKYSDILVLIIPVDIVNSFNVVTQAMTFKDNYLQRSPYGEELKETIAKLINFDDTHDSLIAKGYSYEVLGFLIEYLGLTERPIKSDSTDLIRNILMYLEHNYLRDLTLDGLAQKYGYNRSYLSRLFNANLRCGFNQYINALRARYASYLIRTTNTSLTEIYDQSGFNNPRTFNRAFQAYYQLTPLEYKKSLQAVQRDHDSPETVKM